MIRRVVLKLAGRPLRVDVEVQPLDYSVILSLGDVRGTRDFLLAPEDAALLGHALIEASGPPGDRARDAKGGE